MLETRTSPCEVPPLLGNNVGSTPGAKYAPMILLYHEDAPWEPENRGPAAGRVLYWLASTIAAVILVFQDLSNQAVEQLKIRVLDTIGVAIGALDAD
jgi:hypothetical protein